MGESTSRLGLYKAGTGSNTSNVPDEVVDIDVAVNNNLDKIDAAIGAVPVLSTSHPTTPFPGELIYETDTGLLKINSGGSFQAPTQVGYVPIIPKVSGTGMSVNANGLVTLNNATGTVTLDQIFANSHYEDFDIWSEIDTAAGTIQDIPYQFRTGVAGSELTDAVAGHYRWCERLLQPMNSTPAETFRDGSTTSTAMGYFITPSGSGGARGKATFYAPNRAASERECETKWISSAGVFESFAWVSSSVGAATGLALELGAMTLTGRIKIFGISALT